MSAPGWGDMLRVFGRIGCLSFGGPAAQIAVMHRELVEKVRWLDEPTFLRALSLAMLLPGPEAMQLATYAGWRLRGVAGGLLAGALFVLPGAFVIAALVALYVRIGDLPATQAAFLGIKAAVVVIVAQAVLRLSRKALKGAGAWVIAALSFLGLFALDLPFPAIVAAAALWGFVAARPGALASAPPAPARVALRPVLLTAAAWLIPLVALSLAGGGFLADLGWFFAWLSVVSFGGAYALLGYLTQTVIDLYGWIDTGQMIDALGLAETTPGPLILVTQFVAMLAGYLQGGAGLALAAGLVGLWALFVPCLLWIFIAGPLVERIASLPRLDAALSAITAAVVGVILSLAIWFTLNVLFQDVRDTALGPLTLPVPAPASLDPAALGLLVLAALLFLWRHWSLLRVLPTLATAGLLLGWAGV